MPARTNSTTAKPATAAPVKRFELPALDFRFASLTDGTNIPPPPPSPVRDEVLTPPKTPREEQKKVEAIANGKASGVQETSPQSNISQATSRGTKREADDHPASPTLSTRQGSIRRLFSKNLLNSAYQGGEEIERPESRTSIYADAKKSKRSSGWFSRLRSNESSAGNNSSSNFNKRASIISGSGEKEKKPNGPPPPMIPELSELKSKLGVSDDTTLGSDLFKDIK